MKHFYTIPGFCNTLDLSEVLYINKTDGVKVKIYFKNKVEPILITKRTSEEAEKLFDTISKELMKFNNKLC